MTKVCPDSCYTSAFYLIFFRDKILIISFIFTSSLPFFLLLSLSFSSRSLNYSSRHLSSNSRHGVDRFQQQSIHTSHTCPINQTIFRPSAYLYNHVQQLDIFLAFPLWTNRYRGMPTSDQHAFLNYQSKSKYKVK